MTDSPEPRRTLAVVRGDATSLDDLKPHERRFAELYFGHEKYAGNATQCYLLVYPEANYATASVEGSSLLKEPCVIAFLAELRERAIGRILDEVQPWTALLPRAQAIIVATAERRLKSRLSYEAAVYLVNRVMGSPTSSTEIHVKDHDRISRAAMTFAKRVQEEAEGRARAERGHEKVAEEGLIRDERP